MRLVRLRPVIEGALMVTHLELERVTHNFKGQRHHALPAEWIARLVDEFELRSATERNAWRVARMPCGVRCACMSEFVTRPQLCMKEGMARSYVNNTKRTASLDLQFVLAVKETVDIGRHEGCGERR
jgi:hypothetical protein